MLAIVAPGQGAQTPGFLVPWLEDPAFSDRLRWLSAVADMDLLHYGSEADAETIRDTAVAQPLLVASALASGLSLYPRPADVFGRAGVAAGHSVGELAAAALAGVVTFEQAMVLVRERGRAMAQAAAVTPTGMTAVLGGNPEEVSTALERHGLTPANVNGGGQVVAAGTLEQLAAFAEDPPARARLVPLTVAGAFHTEHMAPAVASLEALARSVSTGDPRTRLLSNRDGQVVHGGREALDRIVAQVASPVRWDRCMQTMLDLGVTGLLELPPAGTLAGLAKRGLPGVQTFALKTPDQLDDARAFVEEHAVPGQPDVPEASGLLVAPAAGTFAPTGLATGTRVTTGDVVGTVTTLKDDRQDVVATSTGTVLEWLVADGDPVTSGQPLLRLDPQAVTS